MLTVPNLSVQDIHMYMYIVYGGKYHDVDIGNVCSFGSYMKYSNLNTKLLMFTIAQNYPSSPEIEPF